MKLARFANAISLAVVQLTRTCVHDAAGRLRPLYPLHRRWPAPPDDPNLPKAALARVEERIASDPAALPTLVPPASNVFIGFAGCVGILWAWGWSSLPLVVVFLLVTAGRLVLVVTQHRLPRLSPDRIVIHMLRERLCPSCAYPFPGDPREELAAAACTECGGRWIIPAD